MKPSSPTVWIQPRADCGISLGPVSALIPAARAPNSRSPTYPTSGSVKVTRGTARSSVGKPGRDQQAGGAHRITVFEARREPLPVVLHRRRRSTVADGEPLD